jgi:hypothetical protein
MMSSSSTIYEPVLRDRKLLEGLRGSRREAGNTIDAAPSGEGGGAPPVEQQQPEAKTRNPPTTTAGSGGEKWLDQMRQMRKKSKTKNRTANPAAAGLLGS